MKVKDVMTKEVVKISQKSSLREAAKILRENEISGAPVVEDGELIGMISEKDILKTFKEEEFDHQLWLPSPFELVEIPIRQILETRRYKKLLNQTGEKDVISVMTKNVSSIKPTDEIQKAAKIMTKKDINRLPVIEEGEIVGIVAREDIINSLVS